VRLRSATRQQMMNHLDGNKQYCRWSHIEGSIAYACTQSAYTAH
jgi:hypothetical protein